MVRQHEETSGDDGNILYLHFDSDYMDVYIYQAQFTCTPKWVHFTLRKSYLNKIGLERKKESCRITCSMMNLFV